MFTSAQTSLPEPAPDWLERILAASEPLTCTCPCRCDLPATVDGVLCRLCDVSEHADHAQDVA